MAQSDISEIEEILSEFETIILDFSNINKNGITLEKLSKLYSDIQMLSVDSKPILDDLSHLNSQDLNTLGTTAFTKIKNIISQFK